MNAIGRNPKAGVYAVLLHPVNKMRRPAYRDDVMALW